MNENLVKLYEIKNESIDLEVWIDINGIKKCSLLELCQHEMYLTLASDRVFNFFFYTNSLLISRRLLSRGKLKDSKLVQRDLLCPVHYAKVEEFKNVLLYYQFENKVEYENHTNDSKPNAIIFYIIPASFMMSKLAVFISKLY